MKNGKLNQRLYYPKYTFQFGGKQIIQGREELGFCRGIMDDLVRCGYFTTSIPLSYPTIPSNCRTWPRQPHAAGNRPVSHLRAGPRSGRLTRCNSSHCDADGRRTMSLPSNSVLLGSCVRSSYLYATVALFSSKAIFLTEFPDLQRVTLRRMM